MKLPSNIQTNPQCELNDQSCVYFLTSASIVCYQPGYLVRPHEKPDELTSNVNNDISQAKAYNYEKGEKELLAQIT